LPSSVTGGVPTIDIHGFASNERRVFQEQDRVDDVADFPHAADWVQSAELCVGLRRMHRGLYDARRHRINADATFGVLDGQGSGGRVQASLRQRGQHGWDAIDGMVDEAIS